jgi:hypothetical protein
MVGERGGGNGTGKGSCIGHQPVSEKIEVQSKDEAIAGRHLGRRWRKTESVFPPYACLKWRVYIARKELGKSIGNSLYEMKENRLQIQYPFFEKVDHHFDSHSPM